MDYGDIIGNWEVIEINRRKIGFRRVGEFEFLQEQYCDVNIEGLKNKAERLQKINRTLQTHMYLIGFEGGKKEVIRKFKELWEM